MTHRVTIDMANYNTLSDEDKDKFYLEYVGKHMKEVDEGTKITFTFISVCVYLYLKSSEKEQQVLWNLYRHPLIRYFCDHDKYKSEKNDK